MPAKTPIYLKSNYSKKGKKCRLRDILSPDMISPPLGDFRHTIHIGKGGECDAFGDMSFLQGNFELLPGKGGRVRPQYGLHGEFTRANSASDASYVETPSPVLKNAISLPTIGGSQALTLPMISTTVFPMTHDNMSEPSTPPAGSEDLEILQMETLLQSISIFRSDPSPVPEEDEPMIDCMEMNEKSCMKKMHSNEKELETFLSVFVNGNGDATGNFNNGNNGDRFIVYSKASSDWWKGEVNGSKGLIPNKYISVQSVDAGQDQKGKETLKSSCGRHQTEEEVKAEKSTRLKVTTDKAGVGPSQVTSGKISLQLPTGQFLQPGNSPGALRKTLDPQMRRSTTEGGCREECSTDVDKEVHHMMHSVFKELLNRQSSPDQNTSASSETTSTVQTPSVRGLGWKGKGLFRSADNAAD